MTTTTPKMTQPESQRPKPIEPHPQPTNAPTDRHPRRKGSAPWCSLPARTRTTSTPRGGGPRADSSPYQSKRPNTNRHSARQQQAGTKPGSAAEATGAAREGEGTYPDGWFRPLPASRPDSAQPGTSMRYVPITDSSRSASSAGEPGSAM